MMKPTSLPSGDSVLSALKGGSRDGGTEVSGWHLNPAEMPSRDFSPSVPTPAFQGGEDRSGTSLFIAREDPPVGFAAVVQLVVGALVQERAVLQNQDVVGP